MHYVHLSERKVIEISGDDAAGFLQGLVSNDVTRLREGVAIYTALLTPQGKFLHDFFLTKRGSAILLDCAAESLPDLLSRLNMYKLRSKVAIAAMPENVGVVALWGDDSHLQKNSEFAVFADPRLTQLGWRIIGNIAAIESCCAEQKMERKSSEDYNLMRLELGVPDGAHDMTRERSLLLEFAFEDLNGVDFKKGCYVGQEVTARSKYRGQVRKFIYQVRAQSTLPPQGTAVTLDGEPAGELRSSQSSIGLALLNVAMVEKAQAGDKYFHAGDITFKAGLPSWVSHPPKALTIAE